MIPGCELLYSFYVVFFSLLINAILSTLLHAFCTRRFITRRESLNDGISRSFLRHQQISELLVCLYHFSKSENVENINDSRISVFLNTKQGIILIQY